MKSLWELECVSVECIQSVVTTLFTKHNEVMTSRLSDRPKIEQSSHFLPPSSLLSLSLSHAHTSRPVAGDIWAVEIPLNNYSCSLLWHHNISPSFATDHITTCRFERVIAPSELHGLSSLTLIYSVCKIKFTRSSVRPPWNRWLGSKLPKFRQFPFDKHSSDTYHNL